MHNYFLYNFLMFFYMYSVMVFISVPVGPRPVYMCIRFSRKPFVRKIII